MMITVMMWACLVLFSVLAIGLAVSVILTAMGVFFNLRRDPEMAAIFAIMMILCAGLSTGFVFAAIAMGRNLL